MPRQQLRVVCSPRARLAGPSLGHLFSKHTGHQSLRVTRWVLAAVCALNTFQSQVCIQKQVRGPPAPSVTGSLPLPLACLPRDTMGRGYGRAGESHPGSPSHTAGRGLRGHSVQPSPPLFCSRHTASSRTSASSPRQWLL